MHEPSTDRAYQKFLSVCPQGERNEQEAPIITTGPNGQESFFSGRMRGIGIDSRDLPGVIIRVICERNQYLTLVRPRKAADLLIAATAQEHGLTVVTRNVRHFEPTGVAVLNPWNSRAKGSV